MPIYAKSNNNEYNKIIDIFDTNGIDITDVYHDDQLVYTVSKDILGSTELYYNTNRYDITNFRVYGNIVQDGTPTPDAPVDVVGCGVRTGNLYNINAHDVNNGYVNDMQLNQDGTLGHWGTGEVTEYIEVAPGTAYRLSNIGSYNSPAYCIYDANKQYIFGERYSGQAVKAINVPLNGKYVRFTHFKPKSDTMLNLGSAALPYEPYGYKLPLTVNGVEYPIYLGQVETTRRIKKLVLTGEETFVATTASNNYRCRTTLVPKGITKSTTSVLSTHYFTSAGARDGAITLTADGGSAYFTDNTNAVTSETFKSYLSAQYAAGTPVTVWYVLAEPETAVVNEPLMKIGEYSDSINIVQSNPQLKLDIGENNISILTSVPPSNMELQAKGGISASGTSPLQITRKSEYLSDYKISGDTLQDGTPSPDMPIEVVGSGVRTGNLFDAATLENGIYLAASGNKYGDVTNGIRSGTKIKVLPNTAYTLSAQSSAKVSLRVFEWNNGTFVKQTPIYFVSGSVSLTVTTTAETTEIAFNIEGENGQHATSIMLNLGSTALPYEPYGYKLPLTVNGVEYPIYLGQVETTRRIKKLVLTGTEVWSLANRCFVIWYRDVGYPNPKQELIYCTHYKGRTPTYRDSLANGQCMVTINQNQIAIKDSSYETVEDFKSYLAAQYAAGTPVTVWYVLAEPENAIINEPLYKIGDYADTVSFAQAGVTIPTVNGANVLDMASTVKPSVMYIKGKGIKPTGYGQLTDVNSVNILDKDGRPIYVHGQ